jgi:ADP-heptose:LPS heptosyltransferase
MTISLRSKQLIDYFCGLPLIGIISVFGLLKKSLKPTPSEIISPKQILFIKMQGGGSLVVALPALLGIRNRYPDTKIIGVVTPGVLSFAELLGVFDELMVIEDRSFLALFFSTLRIIRSFFNIEVVVDLEVYSRLTTCLSFFLFPKFHITFFLDDLFLRKNIATHLIYFNRAYGAFYFYEQIARLLVSEPASFHECRASLINNLKFDKNCTALGARNVTIGTGCSDFGQMRKLNQVQWEIIIQRQNSVSPIDRITFLGTEADRLFSEKLIKSISAKNIDITFENLSGKISLAEALRSIYLHGEYWGVDSGLLHFARILCRKVLSAWGPTDPRTRLKDNDELEEQILYSAIPCSPCIHVSEEPPCGGNNLCIKRLFTSVADSEVSTNLIMLPTKGSLNE